MICFVALIVFGIMGVFSAYYRRLAKEAFECVFRTVTLRPCDTGFDKKMKAKITGKLSKKSPKLGRVVYKHFAVFSWIMVVITLVSMVLSAQAVYNIIVYNNCNGPNSNEACVITGQGFNQVEEVKTCDCGFDTSNCTQEQAVECNYDCNCLEEICGAH